MIRPAKEVISGLAVTPTPAAPMYGKVQHNIFVNTTGASGTITFVAIAKDGTAADTITATYSLPAQAVQTGTGGIYTLSLAPSTSFFRTAMLVTFSPKVLDRIKIAYTAVDGSGNPLNCSPPFATIQDSSINEVIQEDVIVDTDGLSSAKFTVQGVTDTGYPIGPSTTGTFTP